jgi:transposase InsO family protein
MNQPIQDGVGKRRIADHFVPGSHRIDQNEFYQILEGIVIKDAGLFNEKLKEWENFYNYHRPYSALGGQTPYERFREEDQQSSANLIKEKRQI